VDPVGDLDQGVDWMVSVAIGALVDRPVPHGVVIVLTARAIGGGPREEMIAGQVALWPMGSSFLKCCRMNLGPQAGPASTAMYSSYRARRSR
jgi:hypothetical protein